MAPNTKLDRDAHVFYQQGVKYQQNNDLGNAAICFHQTIKLEHNNHHYYHGLGETLTRQNKLTEAIEIDSTIAAAHDILGKALFSLGKIDEAIEAYLVALQLEPTLAIANYNLGSALAKNRQLEKSILAYQTAIKYNSHHFWSYYEIAQAFIGVDNYASALKYCRQVVKIQPALNKNKIYNIYFQIANILIDCQQTQNVSALLKEVEHKIKDFFFYLRIAQKLAKFEKAISFLSLKNQHNASSLKKKKSMASNIESNQNADIFYQQGIKHQQKKDLDSAIICFHKAITLDPKNPHYHHSLGEIFTRQNKLTEAITYYQKAIALKPDFFWPHHCMAMSLVWLGRYKEALAAIYQALEIDSSLAASHDILGKALFGLEKIDQAIEAYLVALKLEPKLAIAHHNLGDALVECGQFTEAVAEYQQAIEYNPNSFWSYYGLGQAWLNLNEYELAKEWYQKALEIKPDSAPIYSALAQLEQRRGRYNEASSYYQKAITLNPTWDLPYTMLQYLPVEPPQLDRLIDFYRTITAKHDEAQLAWGNLGDALTAKGQLQEASKCYQNFCYQNTIASQPHLAKLQWKPCKETAPDFIIIGAGKCGTSSLHKYICAHPQVLAPHKKELNFFHGNFNKGVDWYLSHFPSLTDSADYITGEASPVYFHAPQVDERIHSLFPQTKLIVLLRNPVDRAISWHYHQVKCGNSNQTAEVEIKNAIAKVEQLSVADLAYHGGHIQESLYFYKLQRWMNLFPPAQFLVLQSEDFFSQPQSVMTQVFNFLELPAYQSPHYKKYNGGLYVPIEDSLRQTLSDYFRPHNQKLEQYLQRSFDWH